MTDFLPSRCTTEVVAMDPDAIRTHLASSNSWQWRHDAIEKTYSFRDFHETVAFVNAVAWICHLENHHPELGVSFDRCVVRFNTHSVNGISVNDFICAAKVDALVAFVG